MHHRIGALNVFIEDPHTWPTCLARGLFHLAESKVQRTHLSTSDRLDALLPTGISHGLSLPIFLLMSGVEAFHAEVRTRYAVLTNAQLWPLPKLHQYNARWAEGVLRVHYSAICLQAVAGMEFFDIHCFPVC